jgi:subtilisin family serine protease
LQIRIRMKVLILLAALVAFASASSSNLEPSLAPKLTSRDVQSFDIFLSFDGNKAVLSSIKTQTFPTRTAKITQMRTDLIAHAKKAQAGVLSFLASQSTTKVQSFWVNNQIYVRGASQALVNKLASFPEVTYIREEKRRPLINPIPDSHRDSTILAGWNVEQINAHLVWDLEGAGNGTGVRIGTIDTGVRATHVALDEGFGGENSWRDPYGDSPAHNDQNGHGTHTMGTIVGRASGIGVAPGATWMACRGCDTSSCTDAALLDCGQWTVCPTAPDGTSNPDCSKAPVLSSNSWGSTISDPFYNEVIDTWNAAGIIPIFANGNSGPNCNTTGSPADYNVIAVGSTNNAGALSTFSSKGPSLAEWNAGDIRPHISAPGTDIYSSYYLGPTSYYTMSGTSMACPHIAGVVALMFQVDPELSFAEVVYFLTTTANTKDLTLGFRNCGGIEQDVFPNNSFGYGRVDALAAVQAVLAAKKAKLNKH